MRNYFGFSSFISGKCDEFGDCQGGALSERIQLNCDIALLSKSKYNCAAQIKMLIVALAGLERVINVIFLRHYQF